MTHLRWSNLAALLHPPTPENAFEVFLLSIVYGLIGLTLGAALSVVIYPTWQLAAGVVAGCVSIIYVFVLETP